jgi:hypothetical protein
MKQSSGSSGGPLSSFLAQHDKKIIGVLEGFDRVRVQATLRSLYHPSVMEYYLLSQKILFKDFKSYLTRVTGRVRGAASALAKNCGRKMIYLQSTCYHKEDLARDIMRQEGIDQGLITVISAVEPCRTWFIRGNRETKHLELKLNWGKCIHLYFYYLHQQLGFLHLRLQTWFPFLIQICFNGREWLSRQLDAEGIGYRRRDNCFVWVEDLPAAQRLLDEQAKINWQDLLQPLVDLCHPLHPEICRPIAGSYYWSVAESEYATDVLFKNRRALEAVYPPMVHHSVMSFGSEQVLRFLQKREASDIQSDRRRGPDGVRVKHWVGDNSLKLYDKGSVLRSEVTINEPKGFRVFRASELHPEDKKQWRILRRTVVDVPRRAEVCRAATHRHLEALAVVELKTPLAQATKDICRPRRKEGRPFRALDPLGRDAALLQAVNRLEWAVAGFQNRDIRQWLYPKRSSAKKQRQRAAQVGRQLALLRAHGLVRRVPGRHLYHVTAKGRRVITALLAARQANVQQLTKMAA